MSELEEILPEWLEFSKYIENEQAQSLEEDSIKLKELTSQREALESILNSEKQVLMQKESNLSRYEDNLKHLEEEKVKYLLEIESLETQKKNLTLKTSRPNLKDQRLLEKGQKKFTLFKKLTRIKWDYAHKENVKGYITNNTDYIQAFCFTKDENYEVLTDMVWKKIECSCGFSQDNQECNKENVIENI